MISKGFTIIEVLVVVVIIGILGAIATPVLSNYYLRYQKTTAEDRLLGALRKAQIFSMQHRLGKEWGVCINGAALRLFAGSCTSPTVYEDWTVPGTVAISGLTTLKFGIYRGEPSTTTAIVLTTTLGTTTVTPNVRGGLDVN